MTIQERVVRTLNHKHMKQAPFLRLRSRSCTTQACGIKFAGPRLKLLIASCSKIVRVGSGEEGKGGLFLVTARIPQSAPGRGKRGSDQTLTPSSIFVSGLFSMLTAFRLITPFSSSSLERAYMCK